MHAGARGFAIPILRYLLIAGVFAVCALAQTGQVKSEGQAIPGATVRATQGDRVLLTVTDETGAFHFDGMTNGSWIVEVDMFGFERARKEVQIPSKIDFALQLRARPQRGGAQQTPDDLGAGDLSAASGEPPSIAAAPQIGAEASNESMLITGSVSQGLQTTAADLRPDDFRPGQFGPGFPGAPGAQAAQDVPAGPGAPGVNQQAQAGPAPGMGGGFPGGGPGFGGGGGRGGGGAGGFGGGRGGGRAGQRPPRDRNGNPAFIGNRRASNNRITGSIYYQSGNSVFNARPFAVNGLEEPKAAYAQNRFGFSAGGPLFVPHLFDWSKIFWFINYQGNLSRNGVDQAYTVPTAAERSGDFSALLPNTLIYPRGSAAPYPNNVIPAADLSANARIAQGLLAYIPLPNQPGLLTQNYRLIVANPVNTQSLNTRLNTTVNQRDTLAFTFNWQKRSNETHEVYGCCDSVDGQGINTNVSWRHRIGTRNFNNLVFNFNRNTNTGVPFFQGGPDVAAQLGIQGTSPDPRNYGPPTLTFTNFSSLTGANATHTAVTNFGLNDNFLYHKGKHNWNFGAGATHYLNNSITDQNGRGSFSFSGLSTASYNSQGLAATGTGYDFADFLLGLPETSSIRYGDSAMYYRSSSFNAFVVDDWRLKTGLSLNLGIRWEFFQPWSEKYGHAANLDIAPGFSAVAPVLPGQAGPLTGVVFPAALIQSDKNNFAPRAAIAWKPWTRGKTLIRAGYGWYYNPSQYNQFMNRLGQQPPFAITNSATTSTADVLSIATGLVAVPVGKTVTNTYAVALNYLTSYAQTWNVSIQEDLPKRWIMELNYMGTKGTRLDVPQAPNQAPLGSSLTAYQRLPIANIGSFTFDSPEGDSIMHALQVRFTRRFQRGISANLFYTFSKSLDDVALAQNFYDQSAERALSNTNRTHAVTANWVLASPVDATRGFLSHPEWVAKSLKDWTLSGSLTAQTGLPQTATVLGNQVGTASIASLRPDATGLPLNSGTGYFNAAAFAIPAPGTFGNAGRNTIIGPGMWVVNLSLARSINLHSERRRLEIRFDSTNTLNHVNPSGLITVVNSAQYGEITSAGAMRQITGTVRLRF